MADFLETCPKQFIVDRYMKVVYEKQQAVKQLREQEAELQQLRAELERLRAAVPASVRDDRDTGDDKEAGPMLSDEELLRDAPLLGSGRGTGDHHYSSSNSHTGADLPTCTVCLEEVKEGDGLATATLSCGHRFHFECITLAFSAKRAMICPSCRNKEPGTWKFSFDAEAWDREQAVDAARRSEIEDRYVNHSSSQQAAAAEAFQRRQESLVSRIMRRTMGVVSASGGGGGGGSTGGNAGGPVQAVMVPVPCVAVDEETEMRAITCGFKRTIVLTGNVNLTRA